MSCNCTLKYEDCCGRPSRSDCWSGTLIGPGLLEKEDTELSEETKEAIKEIVQQIQKEREQASDRKEEQRDEKDYLIWG